MLLPLLIRAFDWAPGGSEGEENLKEITARGFRLAETAHGSTLQVRYGLWPRTESIPLLDVRRLISHPNFLIIFHDSGRVFVRQSREVGTLIEKLSALDGVRLTESSQTYHPKKLRAFIPSAVFFIVLAVAVPLIYFFVSGLDEEQNILPLLITLILPTVSIAYLARGLASKFFK